MKTIFIILGITGLFLISSWSSADESWLKKNGKSFVLYYTAGDKTFLTSYEELFSTGIQNVQHFFDEPFQQKFSIYIHPGRKSLDSTWSKDWNMAGFKSECWMVASGVAKRVDIISPRLWDEQSCEHRYSEKIKTQQLITHELVHVFHGQKNGIGDFSDAENIDWFVEGLATYASGQLDSSKTREIISNISNNKIPSTLDKFWTGKLKYGLSGSVVMYIDKKYGRAKLKMLLPYTKKQQVLDALNSTEQELLSFWQQYMKSSNE